MSRIRRWFAENITQISLGNHPRTVDLFVVGTYRKLPDSEFMSFCCYLLRNDSKAWCCCCFSTNNDERQTKVFVFHNKPDTLRRLSLHIFSMQNRVLIFCMIFSCRKSNQFGSSTVWLQCTTFFDWCEHLQDQWNDSDNQSMSTQYLHNFQISNFKSIEAKHLYESVTSWLIFFAIFLYCSLSSCQNYNPRTHAVYLL